MGGDQLQGQASKLEELARARFHNKLSAAELKLVRAAPNGEVAWCGPSHDNDNPDNDPSKADQWGPERQIRAELIRWLCVDRHAKDRVDPQGIRVYAAKVTGELNLSYGVIPFPLSLLSSALTHDASLDSVEIPELNFSGSWVQALASERARVKGSVFLRFGFRAEGEVRLLNARIGGNLECDNGKFINPLRKNGSGVALYADGIGVEGSVFLRKGFRAEGSVRLLGAQIGGNLDCVYGAFVNPLKKNPDGTTLDESGWALSANRASVKGSVQLKDGFAAEGTVDLRDARIEDALECGNGRFKAATLDLRDTSAHSFMDDDKSWPEQGNLCLDGFVYGGFSGGPTDAETRLKWLSLQPEKPFRPQPYLQLAKVLRESGDDDGERRVLVAMEDQRWKADHPWGYPLRLPLKVTAGYGYRPLWAFWEIVGLSALGWIIYRRSYLAGNIVPTDKEAYESFKREGQPPAHHSAFAPLVYSVENSLPLVKLGQGDKWQPHPNRVSPLPQQRIWPTSLGRQRTWPPFLSWLHRFLVLIGLQADANQGRPPSSLNRWGTSARFLRWFLWFQILLGWLLATLFLAGVTGIVRKE